MIANSRTQKGLKTKSEDISKSPINFIEKVEEIVEIALVTTSAHHGKKFLFHKTRGAYRQQALESLLDYASEHKAKCVYTVQWRAMNETELHTSYFSAPNIQAALDKFFFGRDLHSITVFSVSLNPFLKKWRPTVSIFKSRSEGLFKSKGSKHFGYACPVTSKDDVKRFIEELKIEHHSARHFYFAYRLGFNGGRYRLSDDGEPNNSAGPQF